MRNKHTPGPWKLCFGDEQGLHIRCQKNELIADVPTVGHDPSADARLIAAAPELLEALVAVAARLNNSEGYDGDPLLVLINSAIRKAKGEL